MPSRQGFQNLTAEIQGLQTRTRLTATVLDDFGLELATARKTMFQQSATVPHEHFLTLSGPQIFLKDPAECSGRRDTAMAASHDGNEPQRDQVGLEE